MNNQTLVIYDFKILYEILNELENHINFSLIHTKKLADLNFITSNRKNDLELRKSFIKKFNIETVNIFEEQVFEDTMKIIIYYYH